MSPRQMAKYWEEPNMNCRPEPSGCYSRMLTYHHPCWSFMLKKRKVTHIGAFVKAIPTLEEQLATLKEVLKETNLADHVSICDGALYFRYDTDDNTAKENESTYYDIQEELQSLGYTLTNTFIEHDCITGDVIRYIPD